jgi:hypothetical protein
LEGRAGCLKPRDKGFDANDTALQRVAHHLDLDSESVGTLKSTGLTQKDMLGVAFLAKVSGKPILELVAMKKKTGSWTQVSKELGFPMNFQVNGDDDPNIKSQYNGGEESAR